MSHLSPTQSLSKLPLRLAITGGVLFVGFLALGYYGWMETLRHATGSVHHQEVLFHTVELVTGEVAVVTEELHSQHWTLVVAKWGIKILLAAAVFQSALYLLRRQLRRWNFRRVAGHQVFLGLDRPNAELARVAEAAGSRVAVVDADEKHPARADLESRGVLFLAGNPLNRDLLHAAGVARAGRVVAGTDDDEMNVAVAEQVAVVVGHGSGKSVEVLVPVAGPEMRDLLRERWALLGDSQGCHLRLIGFRPVALRHVLNQVAAGWIKAPELRDRSPRILVAADSAFALEFLDLAVPFLQLSGSVLPSYAVCGVDAGTAARFVKCHPDLGLVAEVVFHTGAAADAAWAPGLDGREFDVVVVHLGTETATLAAAARILRSTRFQTGRVLALIDGPLVLHLKPDERLEVLSLFTHGLRSPEFGDHSLEQQARENHDAYLAGLEPAERASAPPWSALPESFKDSNRWAVLHRGVKQALWQTADEATKPALLELLTCSEHQRWMAEKIMDGWRGGPVRDNQRKIHPDIRPFAELSELAKEKDRVQVRKALGLDAK